MELQHRAQGAVGRLVEEGARAVGPLEHPVGAVAHRLPEGVHVEALRGGADALLVGVVAHLVRLEVDAALGAHLGGAHPLREEINRNKRNGINKSDLKSYGNVFSCELCL